MTTVLAAIVGVVVGAAIVLVILALRRGQARDLARQLLEQAETQHIQDEQVMLDRVRATLGELSQQALKDNSEQFLQLAATRLSTETEQGKAVLEARKQLIDKTVEHIAARLAEVGNLLQTIERDRRQAHGTLVQKLETAARTTADLQATTAQLREALASPQRRGQWGERMAEDVLRLAGFIEGVNYEKQASTEAGSRPDFTFTLPQDRMVNMDVKFPLANYLQFLDAPDDTAREQAKHAFLRDVRGRIKEVTTREYINPEQGTVDYVLVFIPNEQVYGFIHQHDPALLDDALHQKVVLCSPLTLYAILAVIRQVSENLRVEQASREILGLLGAFNREWHRYTEQTERLGKSLQQAMAHYEALSTTRTRKLERQLDKIEDIRSHEQIALPQPSESDESAT